MQVKTPAEIFAGVLAHRESVDAALTDSSFLLLVGKRSSKICTVFAAV
jgi:hypothetical protein